MKTCDCDDCKCPPGVCRDGNCKKSYLIFLTARWCEPCAQVAKIVAQLKSEGYSTYTFDVDRAKKVAKRFEVEATPTVIIMDEGKEVTRFVGVPTIDEIKSVLRKNEDEPDYLLGNR